MDFIKLKRILLKLAPYLASLLAAILFYIIGLSTESENFKNLLINISSTFFAIPLIYLFYQIAKNYSESKLNKEIFDYAKLQVDTEILVLLNILYKIVYPLETQSSFDKINKFLSIDKKEIKKILSKNEYLGFQIFKSLDINEENLHEILKNPYILEKLGNDEIISIISIIKNIRAFGLIQKNSKLFTKTLKNNNSFKVVSGKELNPANDKFPDRYLLLKDLGDDKYLVNDHGDFAKYNVEKLLYIFKVNDDFIDFYSDIIADLILEFSKWTELTGSEFLIDSKIFKINPI